MGKRLRVLIVEDSEDDAILLLRELRRGDYELSFERVETPTAMLTVLDRERWDLVICDYSLPHFSAPDALKLLQERALDLPVIIVSGTVGEDKAVAAMKAGAHDFILKGHLVRLIPAIERELREAQMRQERKRDQDQIQASLEEKEVLLKEIHHRVKNNLQVICSLLNLQSRTIQDQSTLEIFKESQNRIRSMALIHEKLYQSEDLSRINFTEYIHDLVTNLFRSYKAPSHTITLKTDISDNILLNIDAAVNCGLIINELVSNSLKYAFSQGQQGEIYIEIQPQEEQKLVIIIGDNGIGLPPNFDFKTTKTLGLKLVDSLVDQLKGTITCNPSQGTEFKIIFTSLNSIKNKTK